MNAKKLPIMGILPVAFCALCAATAYRALALPTGSKLLTMDFAGRTRRYILHSPPALDSSKRVTLVVVKAATTCGPASASAATTSRPPT